MRRHPRRYVEVRSLSDTLSLIVTGALAGAAAGVYLARRYDTMDALIDDVRARLAAAREFWSGEDLDDDELAGDLPDEIEEPPAPAETTAVMDEDAMTLSEAEAAPEPERVLADNRPAAVRALEASVLATFEEDDVLSRRAVDIAAVGSGVIELTGWVHSSDEAARAAALARGVPGVDLVLNRLSVRSPGDMPAESQEGPNRDVTPPPSATESQPPPGPTP